MKNKTIICVMLVLLISIGLIGCGATASKVSIDYGNAESSEAALNAGENLEGKIVQFTATEFKPDSAFGYDIWAGEHLNFVSSSHPDVKVGDTVVVKAKKIESVIGSWIITYEKVDNAEITESTIQ